MLSRWLVAHASAASQVQPRVTSQPIVRLVAHSIMDLGLSAVQRLSFPSSPLRAFSYPLHSLLLFFPLPPPPPPSPSPAPPSPFLPSSLGLARFAQGWNKDGRRVVRTRCELFSGEEKFWEEIAWDFAMENGSNVLVYEIRLARSDF